MTELPQKLDLRSHDIAEDKRQELLRLFPEIRTDGDKLDFDRLKLALGEIVDVGKERYGLNWPGKADCFKVIQAPSLGTLLPCPQDSVDFGRSENLIIEGDNLEVLKLLQKSYLGRVKMVYIDPPYNTGNDFIYPDDYSESLQTYLEYTGQIDPEGRKFSSNTDAEGRFHSKWLNMMYPRLYLARNLIKPDGVILVSVSDVELHNLCAILNEIFGEENWLGTIVWKGATDNNPTRIAIEHEYIVCYARDSASVPASWKNRNDDAKETMLSEYARLREVSGNNLDYIQTEFRKFVRDHSESLNSLTHYNRVDERGPYTGSRKVHNPKPGGYKYDVEHPVTKKICVPPANGYRFPKTTMESLIAEGRILFGDDETQIIQIKEYLKDYEGKLSSVISLDSRAGANEMETLFGNRKVFSHPKPEVLIREIADFCLGDQDIALDFFAGSGTTAHAVLNLNAHDGGNRKFILIQLPAPIDPAEKENKPAIDLCDSLGKPHTIAEITKERVRRVLQKLGDGEEGKLNLKGDQDRGFSVFKLAESNFKPWNAAVPHESPELEKQLALHVQHIRDGRTPEDILYEILIKSGFPPTTPVETVSLVGKTVYSVAGGQLLICLEQTLTLELIRAMADRKPERVVCLDQGFAGNDQLKTNAAHIFEPTDRREAKSDARRFRTV
jgi:adenine-specific DNA-methyltransferase